MTSVLDRTQPPALSPLVAKALPPVQEHRLSGGLPVLLVRFGTQPVSEVQLLYRAGHSYELLPGLDGLLLRMLTEGTRTRSALELAQALDSLGAYVNTQSGYEVSAVSLSVLSRRAPEALALLAEIVRSPSLPPDEWTQLSDRTRQSLAVEQRKTAYHARRAFSRLAYGEAHPYAAQLGLPELDAITHGHLVGHHVACYAPGPSAILVAGQFEPTALLAALEQQFGQVQPAAATERASRAAAEAPAATAGRRHIPLPGQVQSTLRMGLGDDGRFRREHLDYPALRLLTTVLGGYFGSRLMSNIREEKGYTYGIHAQWSALRYGGHFVIGTDVATAYVEPTLEETRRELDRLCHVPIPAAELDVARNYLLGRLLSEQETPFQVADILKNQRVNELPDTDYLHVFEQIRAQTPDSLQALAQSYFKPERMITVVCGEA